MKERIKRIPVFGRLARVIYRRWLKPPKAFTGSTDYWIDRYASGGNSGAGSYDEFARFKAEVINGIVREYGIRSVIEFGCGDGNQLRLADYPAYVGVDISPDAIRLCRSLFTDDATKTFLLAGDYAGEMAELALSLDVIFHLVEDGVFTAYMQRLFAAAGRFVLIYSSDTDENPERQGQHVRHRKFTRWVCDCQPGWTLVRHVPNAYPFQPETQTGSFADFFLFARREGR